MTRRRVGAEFSLRGLRVTVWGKTAGVCSDFPQGLFVDELARIKHRSGGPHPFEGDGLRVTGEIDYWDRPLCADAGGGLQPIHGTREADGHQYEVWRPAVSLGNGLGAEVATATTT
jgi:hypothetical protein